MAYSSKHGKKPFEAASKSSHSRLIHSEAVQEYLKQCKVVPQVKQDELEEELKNKIHAVDYEAANQIQYVIAVDSGSTNTIIINENKSKLAVIQFGILLLKLENLEKLYKKQFVDQKDLQQLKDENCDQLVLPISNVLYGLEKDITNSFRLTIYNFFKERKLLDVLRWLIYEEFDQNKQKPNSIILNCPNCGCQKDQTPPPKINAEVVCDQCKKAIYITDVFGFHEAIHQEEVSSDVIRQTVQFIEILIIINNIKRIIDGPQLRDKMKNILFLVDGQLMIYGLKHPASAEIFLKSFRNLMSFLLKQHHLNLIAIEKSGAFVQYAEDIGNPKTQKPLLEKGKYMLLDSQIIYKYIVLNKHSNPISTYGAFTHYGTKIIFKDRNSKIHVLTTPPWSSSPQPHTFPNLNAILSTIEKMKCDKYDNAVLPIALINKYISLSFNPSKDILKRFLKDYLN